MPYMIADNWLLSYATVEGIGKILYQMNKRTKNRSKMNFAILELEAHYDEFREEFTDFFAELTDFSKNKLKSL
jgi:acyl carrier protein phosphodiesterase